MKPASLFIAYLIVLMTPVSLRAQNLVPNSSFEDYNNCPNSIGAIGYDANYAAFPYIKDWVSPTVDGTTDYFNTCAAPSSGLHLPEATFGFQKPRFGNAIVGLIAWQGERSGSTWTMDFREFLQCKLTQPMQAGQKYCVSFYVSPSTVTPSNANLVAIHEIGINFSATKINQTNAAAMHFPMQVVNTPNNYLDDTSGWLKVQSIYNATGGEQWLTLGCMGFNTPAFKPMFPATPNPNNAYRAYIYIDDVRVLPISAADTITHAFDSLTCTPAGSFNMELTSMGEEGTMLWSTGAVTNSINVNSRGKYWCRSLRDCKVYIDTFNVRYDPIKTLNLGRDTGNCFMQPVQLQVKGNFWNISWSDGVTGKTNTLQQSGQYVVTAQNECGLHKDTINVYVQEPAPTPIVRDTMLCQFSPNPVINTYKQQLNWYTHPQALFSFSEQPLITTTEPNSYLFYVSQIVGYCESERVPLSVKVKYQPRAILDRKVTMCEKYPDSIGKYVGDVNFKWTTGEAVCCITPRNEGLHRLAISNECGTYIDSSYVTFSLCDNCLAVPNAFTPNHDGKNDIFNVILTCPVTTYTMRIFNRWGVQLFQTTDVRRGWTGTYNNIMQDNGVYVYVIEYQSASTNKPGLIQGNVTLLR